MPDYGMGLTNIDHETGIRYGVIAAVRMDFWFEESEPDYGDRAVLSVAARSSSANMTITEALLVGVGIWRVFPAKCGSGRMHATLTSRSHTTSKTVPTLLSHALTRM